MNNLSRTIEVLQKMLIKSYQNYSYQNPEKIDCEQALESAIQILTPLQKNGFGRCMKDISITVEYYEGYCAAIRDLCSMLQNIGGSGQNNG